MKNKEQEETHMVKLAIVWLLLIVAIIVALSLSSCSPSQRLERLLRKNPQLIKTDTLYRVDTLTTKLTEKDTLFSMSFFSDTIIIKQDRLTQKYFYDTKDSTVYLYAKCDADTVLKKVFYKVTTVKPGDKKGIPGFQVIGISIALIIFTFLSTTLYHSFKK